MIATLSGKVSELVDGRLLIEIDGIGYEVNVTLGEAETARTGTSIKLYIHEHIREDQHDLYGFSSREDKLLFEQLLSVTGVGPRMALAIMSSVSDVNQVIGSGNAAALQAVSGVGRRIAERIVVDLRNKIGTTGALAPTLADSDTVLAALVQLGYTPNQAQAALAKLPAKVKTDEERIKQALQELGK